MEIQEALCTGNRRYRAAEPLHPRGVVLHSIGTPQPKASVLRDYWQRDASAYAVHYMVDDQNILHCMPDHYKCWHVGSPGNSQWIGIEMAEPAEITYTGGASFTVGNLEAAQRFALACYRNAVWLIAALCRAHGWDPFTAVYTHREVTRQRLSNTDHVDPQHLWDGLGLGLNILRLRRDVAAALTDGASTPVSGGAAPAEGGAGEKLYRVRKSWADAASQIGAYRNLEYAIAGCPEGYRIYDETGRQVYPPAARLVRVTAASGLNVRKGPGTAYPVVTALPQGGAYTVVEEQSGWGLLKSYETARDGWISLQYTAPV